MCLQEAAQRHSITRDSQFYKARTGFETNANDTITWNPWFEASLSNQVQVDCAYYKLWNTAMVTIFLAYTHATALSYKTVNFI